MLTTIIDRVSAAFEEAILIFNVLFPEEDLLPNVERRTKK